MVFNSVYRVCLLVLVFFLAACSEQSATSVAATQKPAAYIVAANSPLEYFANRLLDALVDVRMPVPHGTDPAQWRPSVSDVLQLQGAELVLLNGAGYSPWVNKVSIADNRVVLTAEPARDHWLEIQGEVTHSHGPQGEHAHGQYAFTTWMDMRIARVQAESVAAALAQRWPDILGEVQTRLETLLLDIDTLDARYLAQAQRLSGRQLIYSHPVYQYFERRYGLSGVSLHWEPDVMPAPEQWQMLEEMAGEEALFVWEAQPDEAIAQKMNAVGVPWVVIEPGANVSQPWLALQQANLERLQALSL